MRLKCKQNVLEWYCVFSHLNISTFALINVLFYMTYKMVLRHTQCNRQHYWGLAFSHTVFVSWLHKNTGFYHINNTYTLHPILNCPLHVSCLWALASEKHSLSDQAVCVLKGTTKQREDCSLSLWPGHCLPSLFYFILFLQLSWVGLVSVYCKQGCCFISLLGAESSFNPHK